MSNESRVNSIFCSEFAINLLSSNVVLGQNLSLEQKNELLTKNYIDNLPDFSGHHRLMFSFDTLESAFINDKTLPIMMNLINTIIGTELQYRICKGAYTDRNGNWMSEVSFLVKANSYETILKLIQYVKYNTRQESILWIDNNNFAQLVYFNEIDPEKKQLKLGKWKQTTIKSKVGLPAYTVLHGLTGEEWYICE